MISRSTQATWLAILALVATGAPIATADTDPIESLKEKLEADFSIAAGKLKMKYLIALEKYQKSVAAEGDLDGALMVKKEIERANAHSISLSQGGGKGSQAHADPDTITLNAKDAQFGNGTRYDPGRQIIAGLSRYGARATWVLDSLKPGQYKMTLNYMAGNLGGGTLSVRTSDDFQRFGIQGTGQWDELRTHNLGQFELSNPDRVTITALYGRGRDMVYIKSITIELVE
jgi:hypothetical protein